jgi:PBSX family phage portal protein
MSRVRRFLSKATFGFVRSGEDAETGALARYKAHVVGSGLDVNQIGADEQAMTAFANAGALEPPLPFDQLAALLTTSNALMQNIEAYAVNIHSFGWRPKPSVDLFGPIPEIKVKEILWARGGDEPTDEDVQKAIKQWQKEALIERRRFIHFFESISPEHTWVQLRRKLVKDYEQLGNAAFEVVRNRDGRIGRVEHIPFVTMRIMPMGRDPVTVKIPQKIDEVTIEDREILKRFFRYIQVQGGKIVWFKEFGDTRTMSAATGLFYADEEAMQAGEGREVRPATEIWHFKQHSMNNVYGLPRWIGNLTSVMGSRMSEEVNWLYFDNKGIPPLAIVFSGGRLSSDGTEKIADFIETSIKGEENFHKILIIEAESENPEAKNLGRASVKFERLTDAQQQDALFQKYDKNNRNKIGESFRIPGLLRGDVEKVDRATAEVLKELTEEQVFEPERQEFDSIINMKLIPRLGFRFWTHDTLSPIPRNPKTVATIIEKLVVAGVLMADEARLMLPKVLGIEIEHRTDEFLREPMRLAIARLRARAQVAVRGKPGAEGDTSSMPQDEGRDASVDPADEQGTEGNGVQKSQIQGIEEAARYLSALRAHMDGASSGEIERILAADPSTSL